MINRAQTKSFVKGRTLVPKRNRRGQVWLLAEGKIGFGNVEFGFRRHGDSPFRLA
jgi:hypothetical protein